MNRLRVENLTRRFDGLVAIDDVSFTVPIEGVTAVIGPNGAGKTTLFNMISGFLPPSEGRIFFEDESVTGVAPERIAGRGLVRTFQLVQLFQSLTVLENVKVGRHVCTRAGLVAALTRPTWARREENETERRARELIDFVGLSEQSDARASVLPYGQQRLLEIARALAAEPKLLLLDEPANGLDPAGIVEIRELLLELTREQGVTVFLASHILAEVSRLAQRIGIIHQGYLLQELDVDELERDRHRRLLLRARDLEAARLALATAGYPAKTLQDGTLELTDLHALEHPDDITSLLVAAGVPPTQVLVEEEDLEQYFLRLVGMKGGQTHA